MEIGDIFIKKNIYSRFDNKMDLHSIKGRPCLLIAKNEQYYYYLSLTSKKSRRSYYALSFDELKLKSYICFSEIRKTEKYYYSVVTKVSKKELFNIMKKLLEYQKYLACPDELLEEVINTYSEEERKILK